MCGLAPKESVWKQVVTSCFVRKVSYLELHIIYQIEIVSFTRNKNLWKKQFSHRFLLIVQRIC